MLAPQPLESVGRSAHALRQGPRLLFSWPAGRSLSTLRFALPWSSASPSRKQFTACWHSVSLSYEVYTRHLFLSGLVLRAGLDVLVEVEDILGVIPIFQSCQARELLPVVCP
jgi:hypothetical protein